jgi:hypothetical protein
MPSGLDFAQYPVQRPEESARVCSAVLLGIILCHALKHPDDGVPHPSEGQHSWQAVISFPLLDGNLEPWEAV